MGAPRRILLYREFVTSLRVETRAAGPDLQLFHLLRVLFCVFPGFAADGFHLDKVIDQNAAAKR